VTETDAPGASGDHPTRDTATVTIAAAPEVVYDLISDVTRMGEWSPECYSCRWLGKRHEPAVGALFVGFNKRGWARWATTNKVERADRGAAFVFRTRETGVRWGYELAAEGDGTAVTEFRDLSSARVWMVKLAGPFVGGFDGHAEELRAGMRETLDRLKAAAEAADPA
jgi:uncharacterized protein YndB with AHSA1/START domain